MKVIISKTISERQLLNKYVHRVKSVRIRSYSRPCFPALGLNNSEYGRFLRSGNVAIFVFLFSWNSCSENFGKVYMKYLLSLFPIKSQSHSQQLSWKRAPSHRFIPMNFCKIFQNSFFIEHWACLCKVMMTSTKTLEIWQFYLWAYFLSFENALINCFNFSLKF